MDVRPGASLWWLGECVIRRLYGVFACAFGAGRRRALVFHIMYAREPHARDTYCAKSQTVRRVRARVYARLRHLRHPSPIIATLCSIDHNRLLPSDPKRERERTTQTRYACSTA